MIRRFTKAHDVMKEQLREARALGESRKPRRDDWDEDEFLDDEEWENPSSEEGWEADPDSDDDDDDDWDWDEGSDDEDNW